MTGPAKLSRDGWLLIIAAALRTISDLFFGAFFISYIMNLSVVEIIAVANYRLFEYFATMVGFILFARWCKGRNKIIVFMGKAIPQVILLLMIIFMGDAVVNYIVPMGLIMGISSAMYNLPKHLMISEKVHAQSMPRWVGMNQVINYITKIVAPVVLGVFITVGSYREMAWALLVVTVMEILLVLFMSPSHHRSRARVDFGGFARCLFRFPVVRKMMTLEILRGFAFTPLSTVITMYTVYMFHTDLNLGILTTVFAIFSIAAAWAFSRWGRRDNFSVLLMICTPMIMGGLLWFVADTTPLSFIMYNFVYATAVIVMDLICNTNTYNLSQSRCVTKSHRTEYFVFRDGALFIGRCVAFIAMLYIGVFGDMSWLRYYLAVVTIVTVICGFLCVKISGSIRNR